MCSPKGYGVSAILVIMHQSIPAVPIPPPGDRGAFAYVVSPGGGAFAILSWPRRLGISIPRGETRAFDTRVMETTDNFIVKNEAFVKDWLVRQGLQKLVEVLKGTFSQFLEVSSLLVSI